jgi:hypothetical protein
MATWSSARNTALVVEEFEDGDKTIELWIGRPSDGPSCHLTPIAAREVAAELIAQANHVDPPAKQSSGPVTVYKSDLREGASSRFEAQLISGELHLRIYPNATSAYYVVGVPIEDVRSVLSEIRDVAFPDERFPF